MLGVTETILVYICMYICTLRCLGGRWWRSVTADMGSVYWITIKVVCLGDSCVIN